LFPWAKVTTSRRRRSQVVRIAVATGNTVRLRIDTGVVGLVLRASQGRFAGAGSGSGPVRWKVALSSEVTGQFS
jgi:hypothetical protein